MGAIAGFYGGRWLDILLMRFAEAIDIIPVYFLLITIVTVIRPSIFNIMMVIGITSWPSMACIVRGQFLSLRQRDYTEASRALGARDFRLIFRHILPNAAAPIIVSATLRIGGAILTESGLSCGRAWRSWAPCWRSTTSAMVSGTPSTRVLFFRPAREICSRDVTLERDEQRRASMSRRSLLHCFKDDLPPAEAAVIDAVDLDYAIGIARQVAGFGTYERGFRPAGSEAVRRCALFLEAEMRRLGLPEVKLHEYPLDGWDFAGARVEAEGGPVFEAVAYGGVAGTPPEGTFGELVDCGTGTIADYRQVDVRGKIALIEMDLEALNWPGTALLEAAHHGATGVVCWPANHYALTPGALHCHDLQVSCPIPMLNVSREDGRRLRAQRRARLFSTARSLPGATGRNVVGLIPGTEFPDELVIIGDHFDAWFDGFMDDAVGVGAVLALAKAVLASGYQPRRTLAFVLHDAEEYGQADSPWDWCTGAFAQISRINPEWAGRAVGAVIFELCGFKEAATYDWYVSPELAPLAEEILERLDFRGRYPLGSRLHKLVTTWEDAFSYTAAGIPSAANLEITDYVRAHYYHTQFDTEALLDPDKYALHVAGLGLLALRLDRETVPPLDFGAVARSLHDSLPVKAPGRLFDLVSELERRGDRLRYRWASLAHGATATLLEAAGVLNRGLTWIGGDGLDETMYPHEQPLRDLEALKRGELGAVAGMGWGQNVSYAVYRRQLFRHSENPDRCWQWAGDRVSPYSDVWHAFHGGTAATPRHLQEAREALAAAYDHEIRVLAEALDILKRL